MTTPHLPSGPGPEAIIDYLMTTYPDTDLVAIPGAWFFSLDAEKHFPNYATIVTNDAHDQASDLERPGVFRSNLGLDRETFERVASDPEPDYTALDVVVRHPVYAAQRYVAILNPSWATWESTVIPLIAIAHDRLAAQRARHGQD